MKNEKIKMYKERYLGEIRKFIFEERGRYRFEIETHHSLQSDLGIYGVDASEFILNFSNKFGVNISNFDVDKYFMPEGYYSIHEEYPNLTIGDLLTSIEKGILS
ncbi:DUF1493 family protein [Flavobacterium sp. MK4S-17]|uniref:DUF1493 family protein n=1 Tax=Flavobacterium sp. MK4S-17 TaxID=2543737 RepID=UPI001359FD15|nr:DUF1493 family protein [Flavobacterium sp. MK4S-17]